MMKPGERRTDYCTDPIEEKECAYCGRIFCPAPRHVFKLRLANERLWFCKYTCKKHWENENKDKSKHTDALQNLEAGG